MCICHWHTLLLERKDSLTVNLVTMFYNMKLSDLIMSMICNVDDLREQDY